MLVARLLVATLHVAKLLHVVAHTIQYDYYSKCCHGMYAVARLPAATRQPVVGTTLLLVVGVAGVATVGVSGRH